MSDSTTTPEATDEKALVRKAYGTATTQLREAHKDEFHTLMKAAAKDLGVDWSPRPTAQEKARKQMMDLLAAHPELAAEVAGS